MHFAPPIGTRPCVVLTRNALIGHVGAITVAEITGTPGPRATHIGVGGEAGLTGRTQSWVNVTGLHTVPKEKLRKQRGRLAPVELRSISIAIRVVLDLDDEDRGGAPDRL